MPALGLPADLEPQVVGAFGPSAAVHHWRVAVRELAATWSPTGLAWASAADLRLNQAAVDGCLNTVLDRTHTLWYGRSSDRSDRPNRDAIRTVQATRFVSH
jgi:hypothetical protein